MAAVAKTHPGLDAKAEAAPIDTGAVFRDTMAWYDRERRDLPWRAADGERPDPYAVWLSEIMLQQTTVKAVMPYFARFLMRWPTVADLAAAEEEAVLQEWAGLGYYSRARNLHKCARHVADVHGGRFPSTEAELLELPGIGPYTAAAIAAIAFDAPVTPVDGNIERVTARLFRIDDPMPAAKPRIKAAARGLAPQERAGDFAQALMDLGATVCTPRRPSCLMCPLKRHCRALAAGICEQLPLKAAKPERPVRRGIAYVARREDGAILLRQRPPEGLLASMLEVPSTEWATQPPSERQALTTAPVQGRWRLVPGTVVHTFTHFRLELEVYEAVVEIDAPLTIWANAERCRWVNRRDLHRQALPSVMRKVIGHVLEEA